MARDPGSTQAVLRFGEERRRRRRPRARARSARFTAGPSGNTSSTSGSITAMLVPWAYLATVAPRTAVEKSYSGRIVSRSCFLPRLLAFFFIASPLTWPGLSGRNQTSLGWPLGKRHHKETQPVGHAEDKIAFLFKRVVRVRHQERERISKYCGGLIECHAVFSDIRSCLLPVPLE
jgi:hypothetical protein